jgi:hypothetical protein
MSNLQNKRVEPLEGHPKYQKVRLIHGRYLQQSPCNQASSTPLTTDTILPYSFGGWLQIKDLNSGTFGFVQLCIDKTTGRQVAIKFIERGEKVGGRHMTRKCELMASQAAGDNRKPVEP